MTDLEEITETPRASVGGDSTREEEKLDSEEYKTKAFETRRNSSGSQSPGECSRLEKILEERQEGNQSVEQSLRPQPDSPEPDGIPTQEDHRARFYEVYHKVAEEYDKEFLKKHDGDLNTTPIFAGLFSAVTSAFIIQAIFFASLAISIFSAFLTML